MGAPLAQVLISFVSIFTKYWSLCQETTIKLHTDFVLPQLLLSKQISSTLYRKRWEAPIVRLEIGDRRLVIE